ncbi:Protein of unknown function [Bacillus wiedmannii]|nr:Protein of unknown function [Bacillus wiedmannii]
MWFYSLRLLSATLLKLIALELLVRRFIASSTLAIVASVSFYRVAALVALYGRNLLSVCFR